MPTRTGKSLFVLLYILDRLLSVFLVFVQIQTLHSTPFYNQPTNRGNLLKTPDGKLAFIDYGMMADIDEDDRYGLFGLVIGLQNKDLPLITENLLKVRY
jgi:aarF domain-containing kinase